MSPTNQELQLSKNCQLFAYLLRSLGKEVPEHIEDCANSYEYVYNCVSELLETLKNLDEESFQKVVHDTKRVESRELAYWWEMQQEADRLHKALSADR